MRRRSVLIAGLACASARLAHGDPPDWHQRGGYPTGWGLRNDWNDKPYRIGNYSGGYEQMLRAAVIRAPAQASPLQTLPGPGWAGRSAWSQAVDRYLWETPVTGFLIARKGTVLLERYQFDRTAQMRLTSWSMAKSVTSLLLGICIDRGLVRSIDDPAQAYAPQLQGTLHGAVTLRNLCNMSSGADVLHERDNRVIYPKAFLRNDADLETTVREWNAPREPQGTRYNYNELCPLAVGMVIRSVTGTSLSAFCQEALWGPLGAEGDASWLRDAKAREYNCIGFAAQLRDWARLGQLIAQNGRMQDRQVVSPAWIDACSSWTAADSQVRHGVAMRGMGYKSFFWHPRADGKWLMMNGAYGQRLLVDRETETVLVQTAADAQGDWQSELFQIFDAASRRPA